MRAGARVSTHFVRPLSRALAQLDVDPAAFLAGCGLAGEHPRRVSIEAAKRAWQQATAVTGDGAVGVRAALSLVPGDFGVLEYAARSSASLRDAFERVARYQSLVNDRAALEFTDDAETTRLRYLQPGLPPAYLEFVLGSWVAISRELPDAPLRLLAVHLTHPAPSSLALHASLFGDGLRFDAEYAELIVDRRAFEQPLSRADSELVAALDRHAIATIDSLAREGEWSDRVESAIEGCLADGTAQLTKVAEGFEMSPRSLRRKLEREGTTFSQLLDVTRKRLALAMVDDDSLSLGEIAFLLGFSEPSAFHRAFRRWVGRTPRRG